MDSYSPNYWVLKVLLVGFCWLLLVGLVISTSFSSSSTTTSTGSSRAVLMGRTSPRLHEEVVMGDKERQKQKELVYNPELDLNYMMSNRKVPNGPDPIHNKKRPPGQA